MGDTMIHITCPHCQQHYELSDVCEKTVVPCPKCGKHFLIVDTTGKTQKVNLNEQLSGNTHTQANSPHPGGSSSDLDWQKLKSGAEEKIRTAFDFQKIENFNFSHFMGQIFKKHPWNEVEEYLTLGTPSKTPALSEISTAWPAPWLFFRMILITIAMVLFMYWKGDFFGWQYIFMPLLVFGVIGIPLAVLVFFWELNTPKNISILLLVTEAVVPFSVSRTLTTT